MFTLVKPPREPSIVVGIQQMTARVDESEFRIRARVRECEIAVLVPCFNEELTVGKTVAAFRESLPSATVYVYDNNSTDRTVDIAKAAGAIVRNEFGKEREMSSVACSLTLTRTSMCWWTGTPLTKRRLRR